MSSNYISQDEDNKPTDKGLTTMTMSGNVIATRSNNDMH